jgi:hypothetical protein
MNDNADPLNPTLYRRLEAYYGEGQVETISAGKAISWRLVREPIPGSKEYRMTRRVYDPGEEYKVRCKICRDHRHRLHINHRWGVYDPQTKSKNLWLANCFNEDCYDNYDAQGQLYERVYAVHRKARHRIDVLEGRQEDPDEIREVRPPGVLWKLDELKAKRPNHPAILYLEERGYDVDRLAKMWDVSYCPKSYYSLAEKRIIFPIYFNGMLVGWQARYVGDNVDGVSFNEAGVAKYWTSPGFKRRLVAYNLERACQHQTVIVVEGPTDTINVGPMACGALGKTLSPYVRKLLVQHLNKNHPRNGVVVIALDPKQDAKSKAKGKPHHLDVLYNQLRAPMQGRVMKLLLPEEYDPGSIDRDLFRQLCREEGQRWKLPVSFGKPIQHG